MPDTIAYVSGVSELVSAVASSGTATTIYLTADINFGLISGSAIIATSRGDIVIDGMPPEGGGPYTISESSVATVINPSLGVRSAPASDMTITFRNLILSGSTGQAAMPHVSDSSDMAGLTVRYENVTYAGPTAVDHPHGKVQVVDSSITLQSYGLSAASSGLKTNRVEIGGHCTFIQNSDSYPVIRFLGAADTQSLTVLTGATAAMTTGGQVLDTSANSSMPALILQEGASLTANAGYTFCLDSSHSLRSVLVDSGASLRIIQGTNRTGLLQTDLPTVYCAGLFTVGDGASVYMERPSGAGASLIEFPTTSGGLLLNNPRSFALYQPGYPVCSITGSSASFTLDISTQQVNYWSAAGTVDPGGLDDTPLYSWRKSDGSLTRIFGSVSRTAASLDSNLTPEEIAQQGALSNLRLTSAPVFSAGNLPLSLDRLHTDMTAISGATAPGAKVRIYSWLPQVLLAGPDGTYSMELAQPLALGTPVDATANTPFLLSYDNTVSDGKLTLESPIADIDFIWEKVIEDPIVYGRKLPDFIITVTDTRLLRYPWELLATISGPLTGTLRPRRVYPDALVHVDSESAVHVLDEEEPIVVYQNAGGGTERTHTISWTGQEGPLLRAVQTPFHVGEPYSTRIIWTIRERYP